MKNNVLIKIILLILTITLIFTGCEGMLELPQKEESTPIVEEGLSEEEKQKKYQEFYKGFVTNMDAQIEGLLADIKDPKISLSWVNGVLDGMENLEDLAKKAVDYEEVILPENYRSAHYDLKENMENFLNISDKAKTSLKNFDVDGLKSMESEVTTAYADFLLAKSELESLFI